MEQVGLVERYIGKKVHRPMSFSQYHEKTGRGFFHRKGGVRDEKDRNLQ